MSCMAAGRPPLAGPAALAERSGLAATAAAVATRSHLGRQLFAAIGSAPLISRAAVALGGVPASQPISLDIALKPRDPSRTVELRERRVHPGQPTVSKVPGTGRLRVALWGDDRHHHVGGRLAQGSRPQRRSGQQQPPRHKSLLHGRGRRARFRHDAGALQARLRGGRVRQPVGTTPPGRSRGPDPSRRRSG